MLIFFFYFKGVFSGSLSPNGVPSSKAAVSSEDIKVHVDFVNKYARPNLHVKQGSKININY